MQTLSRLVFGLAAAALVLLAIGLIAQGLIGSFSGLSDMGGSGKTALLGAVGYVIIAIAVFDVAKYLIEEEVVRRIERRSATEARLSLTKFISTISIAVFLEALVTVFRVSNERPSDMLYPTLLLVAGVLLVLGLGIYQRLSVGVEQVVESDDNIDQSGEKPLTG